MSDPKIVAELRASAEDALSRGFAILTCEPRDKNPYVKYSPHAVNSCTRVPEIALAAWVAGEEANYGVGCGPSNITVVDCDHGLNNLEEFEAWRVKHGFPTTFTVRTGRRLNKTTGAPEYGVQMYYSGAVKTCGFDIGGVTGELKGLGGYVCGPGSIHPDSGEKYAIIKDVPVVSLPEGLVEHAKEKGGEKLIFKSKAQGGELIKEGNRWIHLQQAAGRLRNAGLSRSGILSGLKDFLVENCELGESYPEDKIESLADWACSDKCNVAEATPIVFFSDDKTKISVSMEELPVEAAEGDWIGDLAHHVSDGTFIPLGFARAQIKTILAASINGLVGFPSQPDIHMKQWSMLVSSQPESGKGESWKRTAEAALATYIKKTSVGLPKGGYFSSGEHMVKYLSDPENGMPDSGIGGKNVLVYFDELKSLFEKGSSVGSTLFSKMIELYDREDASAGSLSHAGGEFKNIALNFTGGFTGSSFDAAVAGKGAGGDGFLSRCVLAYTGDITHCGDWKDQDTVAINALAKKMLGRYSALLQLYLDKKKADDGKEEISALSWRFIPDETPEAKQTRTDFQKWLFEKRKEHNEKHPGLGYMSRLEAHFKRDLLMRAVFSGDETILPSITDEMAKRSVEWAKHELYLREELWPVDRGTVTTRMEASIIRALEKHEHLTKMELQRFCNVKRSESGGVGTFVQAWKNMLQGDVVEVVGRTHKNTEKYGLREGF
jgi:hypothetical protein